MKSLFSLRWLVAGDFNETFFLSEKEGRCDRVYPSMVEFRETVEECELIDLGFTDPSLTWNSFQVEDDNIQRRLDRVLFEDNAWRTLYPDFRVSHLDFYGSYHRAVVVELVSRVEWSG